MRRTTGVRGEIPLWMPVFMLAAALGLAAIIAAALRQRSEPLGTAAERAFRSALLPDGWRTYAADVWSVGYPGDWKVKNTTDGSAMYPEGKTSADNYFEVVVTDALVDAPPIAADAEETSAFLFAGYPTTKYKIGANVWYYITYGATQTLMITTQHEDDPDVGIMLATFQFTVKE